MAYIKSLLIQKEQTGNTICSHNLAIGRENISESVIVFKSHCICNQNLLVMIILFSI